MKGLSRIRVSDCVPAVYHLRRATELQQYRVQAAVHINRGVSTSIACDVTGEGSVYSHTREDSACASFRTATSAEIAISYPHSTYFWNVPDSLPRRHDCCTHIGCLTRQSCFRPKMLPQNGYPKTFPTNSPGTSTAPTVEPTTPSE